MGGALQDYRDFKSRCIQVSILEWRAYTKILEYRPSYNVLLVMMCIYKYAISKVIKLKILLWSFLFQPWSLKLIKLASNLRGIVTHERSLKELCSSWLKYQTMQNITMILFPLAYYRDCGHNREQIRENSAQWYYSYSHIIETTVIIESELGKETMSHKNKIGDLMVGKLFDTLKFFRSMKINKVQQMKLPDYWIRKRA